jgi:cbb3-type cytochrome oxidase subunit 1
MANEPEKMYTVDNIAQQEMRMTNGARSDSIVRGFALSSVFWLLVGLVVGLWLAAEMIYPALNLAPWLAFGLSTPTG